MQDSGSLAVFKVAARDQGHNKGPSGAFLTYCNISCLIIFFNNKNIHCNPSLDLSRRDGSNEGSQLLFFGEYAKLSLNYSCYPVYLLLLSTVISVTQINVILFLVDTEK